MKTSLFLLLCGLMYCLQWQPIPQRDLSKTAQAVPVSDTLDFVSEIQPILEKKCNPCHFPGGKMYDSLPFDQEKTIREHPEGVLKRISSGEEGRLLRAFLN
ncbi:MAG: hypothetical protein H6574_20250 [Lewinellaceae bacterium]|nr:hypothetical protein [Saprospiraceae bacterium]MCB9333397.1 hypothetical protein [Lewinellaceae bacterium]